MKKRQYIVNILSLGCAAFLVAGCATSRASSEGVNESVKVARQKTGEGIADASLQPLTDINVRREPIPDLLENMESPYLEVPKDCEGIALEVTALDQILGTEESLSAESKEDDAFDLSYEAGEEAAEVTLDTVRGFTTDIIPFRSLVRRATGAKAYDKKVRRAYEKGLKRRSFLKGIGKALDCLPPAAPFPVTPTPPTPIDYRKVTPE